MPIDWVVVGIIIAVVSGGLSYKAARDAQKQAKKAADAMAGVLINKESNIDAIPVIYGERRVGGTRVFVHTEGGDKNDYLYIALVLCEGEIESITNIEIDDRPITDPRYDGLYSYQLFYGTDDQAASSLLSETSKWGPAVAEDPNEYTLSGLAYIAIRLKWDQDQFSGIPDITALVKGKKVLDPRTNTVGWSDNPALCILDYLRNERYGKGLPDANLDWVVSSTTQGSFNVAAEDIESFTVTPYSGGPSGLQLFKCNAVVDTDDPIFQNLEKLLLCCRGFLPYQNGRYSLYIDQAVDAIDYSIQLNESQILDGISIQSEKKEDKFNRVICKFPNPETKYQPDQAIWPTASDLDGNGDSYEDLFLAEDDDEVLVDEIDLEHITNFYAARDFARIFCLRSRNALRVAFTATSEAIDARVGDVISITHDTPGWINKPFQVESISLKYDGTVDLQCVEYDSTLYAYDAASEETTYADTDLPDPFDVDAPTVFAATPGAEVLSDGSINSYVDLTWTASQDAFVSYYEVKVIGNQPSFDKQSFYEETTATAIRFNGLTSGLDYTAKLRAVNTLGVRSGEVSVNFTAVGDDIAPGAPTNVTAQGGLQKVDVFWTNPTDKDLAYVEVKRSGNSTESNAVIVGRSAGNSYTDPRPRGTANYWYWVRSVDTSGNKSATSDTSGWTAAADNPATTLQLANDDFADGIIDFSFFSAGFQSDFTALEGDVVAVESDVSSIDTRLTSAEGTISGQATAISGLQTSVASNDSDITSLSQSLTSLTTTVGNNTTGISSNLASINGVSAQYSVNIDNNGYISGINLISSGIGQGGTPTSAFIVNADQFAIGTTITGQTTVYPFVVYTTAQSVTLPDGTTTTLDAGVYMQFASIGELVANQITTGYFNLANADGMHIRQGKTSPSTSGNGFWLGNESDGSGGQDAKFYIGTSSNYMYFDASLGNPLTASGITVQATDGTVLLDSGGLRSSQGSNLLYNGSFTNGSDGWSTNGSVAFNPTLARAYTDAGEYIQSQQNIQVSPNEPLYIYSDFYGASGYGQIIFYKSDGTTFTQTTISGSLWAPNAAASQQFRVAKIDYPSYSGNPYVYAVARFGTLSGGASTTWHQVGVSKVPPVIDPSYASTYIRSASIDTAQIANLAVEEGKINNLAVSTLKIQDQAVTFPDATYTGTALTIAQNTSGQQTIQTHTTTSTGAPTEVLASFTVENTSNISGSITIRLRRGSTVLSTAVQYLSTVAETSIALAYFDETTSTGSRTYYVTTEGSIGQSITSRYIRTLECKK
jgi:hypothetical protein